jgi:hypothetical protein
VIPPLISSTPPRLCPTCGAVLDRATSATGEQATPSAGDITLCLYCGHLLEFGPDLKLREPSAEHLRECRREDPVIFDKLLRAQARIKADRVAPPHKGGTA